MKVIKISEEAVIMAAKFIKDGGIVICPTDTVYGFLADATNKKAVEKIFKIKTRPRSKPLPVFVKDIRMAKGLAGIDKKQEKILKKYWLGKFTFILKRIASCETRSHTKLYGADKNAIALRIPKHGFLHGLLKKTNKPLAQTSVNISGQPPLAKIKDIKEFITMSDPAILIIDGGYLPKSKPSTIIDLTTNKQKVLR